MAGMTLDDLWSDVRELTGKLSDVTRQAAYAGLAVIWIFKTGDATTYQLDRSLIWAGVLLALALALDLSQYACNVTLRWFHARHEEQVRGVDYKGKDVTLPKRLNRIPYALFALKVALVAAGYVVLLFYLLRVLIG
jgi:hypothetical protein